MSARQEFQTILSMMHDDDVAYALSLVKDNFALRRKAARWSDPVSLAALEECNALEGDQNAKVFYTTDELFEDCLGDDDELILSLARIASHSELDF